MARDAIAAYDRIADSYRFRTPYGNAFFRTLAERSSIDSQSAVIDLCCGTGAVSAGLSGYCREVVAVDGSRNMIEEAPKLPNVSYHVHDVTSHSFDDWVRGREYDFITIGMGVHWLNDKTVINFRNYLKPGGKILILATGFSGPELNPWMPAYQQIRSSIRQRDYRDWTGKSLLEKQNFEMTDMFGLGYKTRAPLRFLTNHLLSFSDEGETVRSNYAEISAKIASAMESYVQDDKIECHWTSSARIFCDGA